MNFHYIDDNSNLILLKRQYYLKNYHLFGLNQIVVADFVVDFVLFGLNQIVVADFVVDFVVAV
jgi:hypothetical protein